MRTPVLSPLYTGSSFVNCSYHSCAPSNSRRGAIPPSSRLHPTISPLPQPRLQLLVRVLRIRVHTPRRRTGRMGFESAHRIQVAVFVRYQSGRKGNRNTHHPRWERHSSSRESASRSVRPCAAWTGCGDGVKSAVYAILTVGRVGRDWRMQACIWCVVETRSVSC